MQGMSGASAFVARAVVSGPKAQALKIIGVMIRA